MDKKLDELLCLLDGKITVYRMFNMDSKLSVSNVSLVKVQKEIQRLWLLNKESKTKIDGVI